MTYGELLGKVFKFVLTVVVIATLIVLVSLCWPKGEDGPKWDDLLKSEEFQGIGLVVEVKTTDQGVTLVRVEDEAFKWKVGAIAIEKLEAGDKCRLVWIRHYNNGHSSGNGDRVALRAE